MKKILILILVLSALGAGAQLLLSQRRPDSFSPEKLLLDVKREGDLPSIPENQELSSEILRSLSEKGTVSFDYIGHGTQAIAFQSQDGKYVLKLFLSRQIDGEKIGRIPSPLRLMPAYRKMRERKKEEGKRKGLRTVLSSYQTAFRDLIEETGVISLHLYPTQGLFPPCVVTDFEGKRHEIELDRVFFILQKRAVLVPAHFSQSLSPEEYRQSVASLEELFEKRARKGLYEFKRDFPLDKNYGFIGTKAVFIDPGRIAYSEEIERHPELEIELSKSLLHDWLHQRFPAR